MNTRLLRLGTLVMLLCCAGCYSLPKQRGTWSGVGEPIVLYDIKGIGCSCVELKIEAGPTLKPGIVKWVVLVDSKLKTYSPEAYIGKKLRVTGLIVNVFPTCLASGELLVGYRPNSVGQFGAIYVLRVSKIESH
jgi:hypothetical protein